MFLVMQSPRTLCEAETKKGRCSVSGNGPLTYSRQLDVVANAAFVARSLDAESSFRMCWEKSKTSEHNSIFANETAGRGRVKPGSGPPGLRLPALSDRRKMGALIRLVWTVIQSCQSATRRL